MAKDLTLEELRDVLRQPGPFKADVFHILKSLSQIVNNDENNPIARELVLRALSQRAHFGKLTAMLDGLARVVGLFPYADPELLDLRDHLAYEYHRPLNMNGELVFHREQYDVYRRLLAGENVILSAPTSFGKSRIIDALIATEKYKNIAVVVPTLALIDETRRRFAGFSDRYKIITHVSQNPGGRNIFVFTAERVVGYDRFPKIDFFVIDEFYKIDSAGDDESRTIALNQAFYELKKSKGQFYLLGPNIRRIPAGLEIACSCYFYLTEFATVVSEQYPVKGKGSKVEKLVALLKTLDEPTLVYCSYPTRVNAVAEALVNAGIGFDSQRMTAAADWASATYHPEWIFCSALRRGVGIHHGRLPRSLGQYVVRMFNEGALKVLICTSSLIEGVNTKAKNVVIFDNNIANRKLDYFTFNNIKGRSGRMFEHFVGRVYLFGDPPQEELPFVDFPFFSQSSTTPMALLIQLEVDDLSELSKKRLRGYQDERVLPVDIIRKNNGIDPEKQIAIAQDIRENARRTWHLLEWSEFPRYAQLEHACELIWRHFVAEKKKHGLVSGRQLTHYTWSYWRVADVAIRIRNELVEGKYMAKSANEAVDRVLHFERSWMGFELPRCLRALSLIQAYVLDSMGLPSPKTSVIKKRTHVQFM
jgi:Helicase conserved C-terminal domain